MSLWKLQEIFTALGKKEKTNEEYIFSGVSIDTRTIKKGEIFIPIKGKNFDGHNFIEKAFKKGALASFSESKNNFEDKKLIIVVKNTQEALEKLAKYSRKRNKNLVTICVTGSSGKTTLKDWVSNAFKKHKKLYKTKGNLNNQIGLPLTLANMPRNTELCVLELGMNSPGEIKKLSKIAKPNIAIITSIGAAHSGNFSSIKRIAEEKSDIFSYCNKNSIAIIPRETKYFELINKKAITKTNKILTFGFDNICNIKFDKKNKNSKWNFNILGEKIVLENNFPFANWTHNIGIILCLSRILKIDLKKITPILKKLIPTEGRGKISKIKINNKNLTIIDESYNSNPESLNTALQNLSNFKYSSNRIICIIGDMLELGKMANTYHLKATKVLVKLKPQIIITVGEDSKIIFDNLPESFLKFHYYDYKNAMKKLFKIMRNKDVIMLKGSNSINLHLITKKLLDLG